MPVELVTSKKSVMFGVLRVLAGGGLGLYVALQLWKRNHLIVFARSKASDGRAR
jgi:hypothetical protein